MSPWRKAVLLLLALVLAIPLLGQAIPAPAIVITPMTQTWMGRTHGDFIQVGNGVMRCDPTAPPGSATACSNFHAGTSGTNDSLPMIYADADANPATYNSSSATVTIPAGAHVLYAKLFWGGTNGQYLVDNQGTRRRRAAQRPAPSPTRPRGRASARSVSPPPAPQRT